MHTTRAIKYAAHFCSKMGSLIMVILPYCLIFIFLGQWLARLGTFLKSFTHTSPSVKCSVSRFTSLSASRWMAATMEWIILCTMSVCVSLSINVIGQQHATTCICTFSVYSAACVYSFIIFEGGNKLIRSSTLLPVASVKLFHSCIAHYAPQITTAAPWRLCSRLACR